MGGTGSAGSFSGAWRYAALIFLVGACMVNRPLPIPADAAPTRAPWPLGPLE